MKSIIVYASNHGTTRKVAELLADSLVGEVDLHDLKSQGVPNIDHYESVIIGGSIYVGNIQRVVKQFINRNLKQLLKKKVGLFICCMREGQVAQEQFEAAFPVELRRVSLANGILGGEFLVSKMNLVEKAIVKKVSGVKDDVSNIHLSEISAFADSYNKTPPAA